MRSLTADEFIRVWELGRRQDSTEQAVTILATAFPAKSPDELRRLSLGQRNALLLGVRERLFGSELEAFSECLNCGERLEFALNVGWLRAVEAVVDPDTELCFETDGYALSFRLLDSLDLQAAAACADVKTARRLLVERSVLTAYCRQNSVPSEQLPETVIEELAAQLAECDPQAEVLIDLACPGCEFRWQIPFDIALFLTTEIEAQAKRLLREVHTLARAYAWREADILAMGAGRRQHYLELLSQ